MTELKEVSMKVTKGLVFWYCHSGNPTEKTPDVIKLGGREVESKLIAGKRPWVVVSSDKYNKGDNTCNIVPFTSSVSKDDSVRPQFRYRGRVQTILAEQIQTVDSILLREYECTLTDDIMELIDKALADQFGIDIQGAGDISAEEIQKWEERVRLLTEEIESKDGDIGEFAGILKEKNREIQELRQRNAELEKIKDELQKVKDQVQGSRQPLKSVEKKEKPVVEKKKQPIKVRKTASKAETLKKEGQTEIDVSTAVEKFNKRYGEVIGKREPVAEKVTAPRDWTKIKARKFLKDCEELGLIEVSKKYGYKSANSIPTVQGKLKKKYGL